MPRRLKTTRVKNKLPATKSSIFARKYQFRAKVWLYTGGVASWHFLTLPKKEAAEIKSREQKPRKGWGSIRVTVTIGESRWKTSIFPEKKSGSYLLPLKASVRKSENIAVGTIVTVDLELAR
jgi:hypothetical protein